MFTFLLSLPMTYTFITPCDDTLSLGNTVSGYARQRARYMGGSIPWQSSTPWFQKLIRDGRLSGPEIHRGFLVLHREVESQAGGCAPKCGTCNSTRRDLSFSASLVCRLISGSDPFSPWHELCHLISNGWGDHPSCESIKVVDHFEYLDLCLDSKLLMHRAVAAILGRAKKGAQLRCSGHLFPVI